MKTLFYDGFFLPWAALDLPERSLIATLLIGFPVVYVYLTVRYRRLAAEALVTPHIAPISVKGGIAKQLGAREAALILSAHLSAITETFREAKQSSKTAHGEVIALLSEFFGFHPKIELGPAKIEEELVIKVGALELPIGAMVNLLIALSRVVYVPNRRNYLRAQIHVSLVSSETDTQLIVSRGWPYAGSSKRSQSSESDRAVTAVPVLAKTADVKDLAGISHLLRDAAFMILQLVGDEKLFPGRNWLGKKWFVEGLDKLNEFHRTEREELIDEAVESFSRSSDADEANYGALYIRGSLLLHKREQKTIDTALKLFTLASRTEELAVRALVDAGLASCYVQQIHRLAVRSPYVEMKAREHAEAAQREWEKAKSGYASAKILTTLGYVDIATVGAIDTPEGMTRFFDSAKLFHEASKIEPDNALYYNVLGWIFLRLAEWEAKDLRLADRIPPGLVNRIPPEEDSSPAGKSEYHFLESLKCDPTNKLPHANLCRLYALKRYREKDRDESLSRCREHGEAAIRLDPNYINGYRDLTLGLLMYEQFDEAYPHFEKALELTSEQFAAPDKKHREIIGDMLGILEDNPEIEADKEELARWRNPALVTR